MKSIVRSLRRWPARFSRLRSAQRAAVVSGEAHQALGRRAARRQLRCRRPDRSRRRSRNSWASRPSWKTVPAAIPRSRPTPWPGAPADGYTLLVASDAFITVPLLNKDAYDPFEDFTPIGTLTASPFVFVVHPSTPINSLSDLVAYAQEHPGELNYGSSGNGGASHLGGEKFKMMTGTDIVHIPYRGAGPALIDALSGQYQLSLWTPFTAGPHVKEGKLRALAVTGPKRVAVAARRADVRRSRPAGIPAPVVDRGVRARRHAEGDRGQDRGRDRRDAGVAGRCGSSSRQTVWSLSCPLRNSSRK